MKDQVTDVGVIVGRFHVDKLHDGHVKLIQKVWDNHDRVIIFLGLSPIKSTINNPLDFEARKQMLEASFPDTIILYIKDMKSDHKWSKVLDKMIDDMINPGNSVTLYGGRTSFINRYHGKWIDSCMELDEVPLVSGTKIRKKISNKTKASPEFRAGVIWGVTNQFVNAVPCVDIAIFDESGYNKVLLGRKEHEEKFRFVGGHVDASETYEQAAVREAREETGLEVGDLKYITSVVVDDWRHRNEKTKITTAFFKAKRIFGRPEANDDIHELKWFDIMTYHDIDIDAEKLILKQTFVDDHIILAQKLIQHNLKLNVNEGVENEV